MLWGTAERLEGPSWSHLLGTDVLARDVFARTLAGGGNVLALAFVAVVLGALIGVSIGWVAGLLDHRARGFFEWIIDVIEAFPAMILVLFVLVLGGRSGLLGTGILLGFTLAPSFIRATRSVVIDVAAADAAVDLTRPW